MWWLRTSALRKYKGNCGPKVKLAPGSSRCSFEYSHVITSCLLSSDTEISALSFKRHKVSGGHKVQPEPLQKDRARFFGTGWHLFASTWGSLNCVGHFGGWWPCDGPSRGSGWFCSCLLQHTEFQGERYLGRKCDVTTLIRPASELNNASCIVLQEFFSERTPPSAERALKQSLENVRLNSKWLTRESSKIGAWLKEKGYWVDFKKQSSSSCHPAVW